MYEPENMPFINHVSVGTRHQTSSTEFMASNQTEDSTPLHSKLSELAPKALFVSPPNRPFPNINVMVDTLDTQSRFKVNALLDSGATGLYVDRTWIEKNGIKTQPLDFPLEIYNADGTKNNAGTITHEVELRFAVQGHVSKGWFHVVNLNRKSMIIGMEWLRRHNPVIDWIKGTIEYPRCPPHCAAAKSLRAKELAECSLNEIAEIPVSFLNQELSPQINIFENPSTRIAREALANKKVVTLEDIKKGPYADFVDVFSEAGYQELPPHRPWDHAIELVPDWESRRWKARIYPLPPDHREELNKRMDELIESKRIRPSKSPLGSPVFFVPKKDGGLRMVIDYRKLNALTTKNAYPLPLIPELLDKWKGCTRFTKLDVRWGYWNIRVKEGDEWKTAFSTHRGLYEWTVMPFGLCNAPATFQNMMNDVFVLQIRKGDTDPYIDDLIIGTAPTSGKSDDDEVHIKAVREVLYKFREHGLFLKPEKCTFSESSVEYLGYIVSGGELMMDPSKTEAITTWAVPTNLTTLRSFMGFTNFYRRFIHDYATLARPLNDLTKKDVKWHWGKEEQEAFDAIKYAISHAPVLAHPDMEKPFIVEADASGIAYGAILSQEHNGELRPIAFLSHSFNATERNYPVHDREMMAVVQAFREWRRYLLQSPHKTVVLTDHKNLEYFRASHDLQRRQIRWQVELDEFYFGFQHRPGKQSVKPDALSRKFDHEEAKKDNKAQILLPDKWFINSIEAMDVQVPFLEELYKEQCKDEIIQEFNKRLEGNPPPRGWKRQPLHDNVWTFYDKIYVPKPLRRIVFSMVHSDIVSGHPGQKPSIEKTQRTFYWPTLKDDISKWVQQCDVCQRHKNFPGKKVGLLVPNEIPTKPWEIVSMDMLTDLPESEGFDALLIIVDRFSKMIRIIRTNKTMNSEALVRLCWDQVWKDFGVPKTIISDRGPQFASKFTKAHNEIFGIKTALSTAYHPQSDGQSERMIQEVQKTLRMYVNHYQNDWASKTGVVEFALNNTIKSSTGYTPFYLVMGQHPNPGNIPRDLSSRAPSVEEFIKGLQEARSAAKLALEKAAADMKKFADRKRKPEPTFSVGDQVLLEAANYPSVKPSRKLSERRYGPFKILEKVSNVNYRLDIPSTWKIHPVIHVDQLRKYHEDPVHPNFHQPPPDLIDGEEEFEVERILDAQKRKAPGKRIKTLQFLVKWVGYHDKDNTWEPLSNLGHAQELIDDFLKRHPEKQSLIDPTGKRLSKISVLTAGGSVSTDGRPYFYDIDGKISYLNDPSDP